PLAWHPRTGCRGTIRKLPQIPQPQPDTPLDHRFERRSPGIFNPPHADRRNTVQQITGDFLDLGVLVLALDVFPLEEVQ
ncbi:MAG: hypothetical protein O2960_26630, partial [Verrucomicrobia bacterium]|nr:hypothetical protein [Verrucomicrobiota bacterium]